MGPRIAGTAEKPKSSVNRVSEFPARLLQVCTGSSLSSLSEPNAGTLPGDSGSQTSPPGQEDERGRGHPECHIPPTTLHEGTNQEDWTDDVVESSNVSLLVLNATGEPRFLGPSSGSPFLRYASRHARTFVADTTTLASPESPLPGALESSGTSGLLKPSTCTALLQSYRTWVHPIHCLFELEHLERLIMSECTKIQTSYGTKTPPTDRQKLEACVFYLVMALGAVAASYAPNELTRHMPLQDHVPDRLLYSKALEIFDSVKQPFSGSILMVQTMVLISIYGAHKPAGTSQWHLAGLAIRMCIELGLHYLPRRPTPGQNQRLAECQRRLFWTAYALEITSAFNMGRPPSIAAEYVSTELPSSTPDSVMAIHHIRHRQIQAKIMAKVFRANSHGQDEPRETCDCVLHELQRALDDWKSALPALYQQSNSEYPLDFWERFYYSTSVVLHRSSPLCPRPSITSSEKCIRSAGAFIEGIDRLLKGQRIPVSWMFAQGILLTGLSMLVTAKINARHFIQECNPELLLVDVQTWTRICSVCLAILRERLQEDLLSRLQAQFEALSSDTVRHFLKALTTGNKVARSDRDARQNELATVAGDMSLVVAQGSNLQHQTAPRATGSGVNSDDMFLDQPEWPIEDEMAPFNDFFADTDLENLYIYPHFGTAGFDTMSDYNL
ncbi:hypothetical protein LTR92_009885 [Exophiala xenobiotica]|nr:hypothetical protein LTR92_009885 [Exophiala xenobiotica]KAK5552194.1 hypothetical protein LTR46_009794 [Exophiala xenobiotica]